MPESPIEAPPRRTLRYQLDTGLVRLTTAERAARGKAARAAVPRTKLRDWKFSMDISTMVPAGMRAYGEVCGWTLARAHARSGDRIAIAAYLGTSDVFDRAIADFARAYADQNERDHEALADAAKSGRITAEHGL